MSSQWVLSGFLVGSQWVLSGSWPWQETKEAPLDMVMCFCRNPPVLFTTLLMHSARCILFVENPTKHCLFNIKCSHGERHCVDAFNFHSLTGCLVIWNGLQFCHRSNSGETRYRKVASLRELEPVTLWWIFNYCPIWCTGGHS